MEDRLEASLQRGKRAENDVFWVARRAQKPRVSKKQLEVKGIGL